tara:strand:- start:1561 stop:1791 length:231 start_codon:yes stop_codon:yes gene_type:complete
MAIIDPTDVATVLSGQGVRGTDPRKHTFIYFVFALFLIATIVGIVLWLKRDRYTYRIGPKEERDRRGKNREKKRRK